uniref:Uncharacterized protein n=1 Tax=Timema douglasi TaxID=61478 RepID=A0A7R8ZA87_TIMDO|nr:unnamed protein product [Timema douglasi]
MSGPGFDSDQYLKRLKLIYNFKTMAAAKEDLVKESVCQFLAYRGGPTVWPHTLESVQETFTSTASTCPGSAAKDRITMKTDSTSSKGLTQHIFQTFGIPPPPPNELSLDDYSTDLRAIRGNDIGPVSLSRAVQTLIHSIESSFTHTATGPEKRTKQSVTSLRRYDTVRATGPEKRTKQFVTSLRRYDTVRATGPEKRTKQFVTSLRRYDTVRATGPEKRTKQFVTSLRRYDTVRATGPEKRTKQFVTSLRRYDTVRATGPEKRTKQFVTSLRRYDTVRATGPEKRTKQFVTSLRRYDTVRATGPEKRTKQFVTSLRRYDTVRATGPEKRTKQFVTSLRRYDTVRATGPEKRTKQFVTSLRRYDTVRATGPEKRTKQFVTSLRRYDTVRATGLEKRTKQFVTSFRRYDTVRATGPEKRTKQFVTNPALRRGQNSFPEKRTKQFVTSLRRYDTVRATGPEKRTKQFVTSLRRYDTVRATGPEKRTKQFVTSVRRLSQNVSAGSLYGPAVLTSPEGFTSLSQCIPRILRTTMTHVNSTLSISTEAVKMLRLEPKHPKRSSCCGIAVQLNELIQGGPRKISPPPISSRRLTLNWRSFRIVRRKARRTEDCTNVFVIGLAQMALSDCWDQLVGDKEPPDTRSQSPRLMVMCFIWNNDITRHEPGTRAVGPVPLCRETKVSRGRFRTGEYKPDMNPGHELWDQSHYAGKLGSSRGGFRTGEYKPPPTEKPHKLPDEWSHGLRCHYTIDETADDREIGVLIVVGCRPTEDGFSRVVSRSPFTEMREAVNGRRETVAAPTESRPTATTLGFTCSPRKVTEPNRVCIEGAPDRRVVRTCPLSSSPLCSLPLSSKMWGVDPDKGRRALVGYPALSNRALGLSSAHSLLAECDWTSRRSSSLPVWQDRVLLSARLAPGTIVAALIRKSSYDMLRIKTSTSVDNAITQSDDSVWSLFENEYVLLVPSVWYALNEPSVCWLLSIGDQVDVDITLNLTSIRIAPHVSCRSAFSREVSARHASFKGHLT